MNLWRKLSIKSKMLAMVLAASLAAAVAIMAIGFYTGNEAMTEAIEQRLIALRKANAFEVEEYFRTLSGELEVLAMTPSTRGALEDLRAGFREIDANDTIDCGRELGEVYDAFVDRLAGSMDIERDIGAYYPKSVAGVLPYRRPTSRETPTRSARATSSRTPGTAPATPRRTASTIPTSRR